jgi:hypothetical protein
MSDSDRQLNNLGSNNLQITWHNLGSGLYFIALKLKSEVQL